MLLLSFLNFKKVLAQKELGMYCKVSAAIVHYTINIFLLWCIHTILFVFEILFSSKFKSFSYLYNEEQFIAFLKNDVIIAKSLPESLMERRRRNEFPTFKPTSSASLNFYIEEILPKLKKSKVIGLIIADGGALQVFQYY